MKGKKMFITIEGLEGAGKTTQLKYVSEFLETNGYDHIITREPGGTRLGEAIREILFAPEKFDTNSTAELLLYFADRAQHINEMVIPMLAAGKIVVSDRYYDATFAYQGAAKGLESSLIKSLHILTCGNLEPDFTFLLDLSPDEGRSRVWKRKNKKTRFAKEEKSFHEKVRKGYLNLAKLEPERVIVIDGSKNEIAVKNKIIEELLKRL